MIVELIDKQLVQHKVTDNMDIEHNGLSYLISNIINKMFQQNYLTNKIAKI